MLILYLLKWQKKHNKSLSLHRWNAWLRAINLPVTLLNAAFIQVASFRFRHYLVPQVPSRTAYLTKLTSDSMVGTAQGSEGLSQGVTSQLPLSLTQMSQPSPRQEKKVELNLDDMNAIVEESPAVTEEAKVTEEEEEITPMLSAEDDEEMQEFELSISNNDP